MSGDMNDPKWSVSQIDQIAVLYFNKLRFRISFVHFAAGIQVGDAVFHLAYDAGVGVIVVGIIPHRLHRVEVDADDVAMVVAKKAIITIGADAVLYARGGTVDRISQHADLGKLPFRALVFVDAAILAAPEEEASDDHG